MQQEMRNGKKFLHMSTKQSHNLSEHDHIQHYFSWYTKYKIPTVRGCVWQDVSSLSSFLICRHWHAFPLVHFHQRLFFSHFWKNFPFLIVSMDNFSNHCQSKLYLTCFLPVDWIQVLVNHVHFSLYQLHLQI